MNLDRYFSDAINDVVKNYSYYNLDSSHGEQIKSDKDDFSVTLEMPGVRVEDVKITFHKNILNVKAKSRTGKEFSYKYQLSESCDDTKISATLQDGLLDLKVPRLQESAPRVIPVFSK